MNEIELLEQQAVDTALKSLWREAIEINKKLLTLDKKNIPATLRLGFAYLQTSKFKEAKKYYQKALKLQSGNSVAKENLERIKILQTKSPKRSKKSPLHLDPNLFLEIPGKTKSIILVNLGQKNILAQFTVGQQVYLKLKKRKVEIRTKLNDYAGSLPDDISKRLLLFLKAGSEYSVFIKEANLNRVIVFVREEKKGRKVSHYLSFPQNSQANIAQITQEKGDEEVEEPNENELEKLAEALTNEEKDYLPYGHESEEEEAEE
jgi:tetratricopeptide (TPR) repeat protein